MADDSNILQQFLVRIAYDVDKDSEKKLEKQTDSLQDKFSGLAEKVMSVKDAVIALAGAAGVAKLVGTVTDAADKFEALGHQAAQIGTKSAEDLGALQYAFSQMGVEADTVTDGLKNMTDIIGQAKLGEGEGVEVFEKLGISVKDANGNARDTLDIFDELTVKFEKLDHATRVTYINMLGLDTEMVEGMSAGKKGLDELKKAYTDAYAGAGVSVDQAVKEATDFNGVIAELKMLFQTIKDAMGAKFLSVGLKTFTELRKTIVDNMGKIVYVMQKVLGVAMALSKIFITVGKTLFESLSKIFDWWGRTSTLFRTLVKGVTAVTAAVILLNTAFMKSPIGRLLTLVTIIGALIDDFQTWKEGGQSVIGTLIGSFEDLMSTVASLKERFGFLGTAIGWCLENLDLILQAVLALVVGLKPLKWLISILAVGFKGLLAVFSPLLKLIPLLVGGFVKLGAVLLANPIGLIITAIGALIAAGVWLYKNWDYVCEKAQALWDYLSSVFASGVEKLKGLLQGVSDFFSSLAEKAFEAVPWLRDFVDGVTNAFSTAISTAKALFSDFFDFISRTAATVFDIAIKPILALFDAVVSKVQWVADKVSSIVDGVTSKFSGFFDSAKETAGNVVDTVKDAGSSIAKFFGFGDENTDQPQGRPEESLSPLVQASENMSRNFGNAVVPYSNSSSNQTNNITQNNTGDTLITIQASATPQETAAAVAQKQQEVYQSMSRDLRRNIS